MLRRKKGRDNAEGGGEHFGESKEVIENNATKWRAVGPKNSIPLKIKTLIVTACMLLLAFITHFMTTDANAADEIIAVIKK